MCIRDSGYISEDRKKEGLILIHNVLDNASITVWSQIKGIIGFVTDKMISQKVNPFIDQLEVKTPSNYQLISNLSGGNQQKVMFSKWLNTQPKVFILDEPTRGIDVGAKAEVHNMICELADQGMAILCISSDLPEVLAMSDRVLVMREGRQMGILDGSQATQESIMSLAMGELQETA